MITHGRQEDLPRSTGPIRCVVVETVALLRLGLRAALAAEPGISVVGEATTGQDARELVAALLPDVVIIDTVPAGQPNLDGLAVARGLHRRRAGAGLILLTAPPDETARAFAHRVGASIYRRAVVTPADLRAAVRRGADSGAYDRIGGVPSRRATPVSLQPNDAARGTAASEATCVPLSSRDLALLRAVAQGGRNKEIARAAGIHEQTVKNHVTAILRKLGVANRTAAVLHAARCGWITLDPT